MKFLFDSRGKHIANLVNGQLHAPGGKNVGHYLEAEDIFIDRRGRYLGELLYEDRLVRRRLSGYGSVNFGIQGDYGNVGNYGSPGKVGAITLPAGYEDIDPKLLR